MTKTSNFPSSPESFVNPGERLDDLERNGYRILQKPEGFCFGVDAVLLSSFVTARENERVMDFCTGGGILPILMAAKTTSRDIWGMEIQPEYAEMAGRSVALNGLQDRVHIVEGDLMTAVERFGASSFQVITVNPPYMKKGSGLVNPADAKAIARHEISCTIYDIAKVAGKLLSPGGRFYMVHRPARLMDITEALLSAGLEPKRMRMVYPKEGERANLFLLEAKKGGGRELITEPPLILYDEDGNYRPEVRELYGF